MLNIAFILPSSDYLHDPFRGDPHTQLHLLTIIEEHFGRKVNVSLIDLRGVKREFAIYQIHECDLYLHSVYTLDFYEQVSIVNNLRQRYPKAKHIAGGPHANIFQDECLRIFDSLVLGEGEKGIILAISDFMANKLQKIYKQDSPIDINVYPYPSRKYLTESAVARKGLMKLKSKPGFEELLTTTVLFSRGCPYSCAFCTIPIMKEYGQGIRFRKPEFVTQEIEYLKKTYHIEAISLIDEIGIPFGRQQAIEHLEAIGKTGLVWKGQSRIDSITPEIAQLLKEAGCEVMCLGVESVHQKSLDIINKRISVDKAKEVIGLLKKNGIETRIYLIIGLPAEPDDIVERTWSFIEETAPELVHLSIFTVRPGTDVFNNPEKFGIRQIFTDWNKTMHMYSRYDDETPSLTFEYEDVTPWGRGFSSKRIVDNYLELQSRLKERDMANLK